MIRNFRSLVYFINPVRINGLVNSLNFPPQN
jgi:hypothetical protein